MLPSSIYLCCFCTNTNWRGLYTTVSECDCLVGRHTLGVLLHFYIQTSVLTRHNAQQRPRTYKQKYQEITANLN